jgi:phosphate-selective porin OprO/OprP
MRTLVAAVVALALSPSAALAQRKPVDKGFVWDNRPSIVFGRNVNVDVRMKVELDWREFDPKLGADTFENKTRRLGLKGELTRHFEYEIEREVRKDGEWKDVYAIWRTFDAVRVELGRFKVPFSFEQLTGKTATDFAYRSLGASTIAPARDKGGMASGRFFGSGLTYEFGVFKGDGDNGRLREPQFVLEGEHPEDVGPSVAARVTSTVLRPFVTGRLRSLRVGGAYGTAHVPEGLNSLRGRSVYGYRFFEPVYVKGRRHRVGAELQWTPGPVGVKAEWMQSREDRLGQGNRDQDLSDFIGTGWFASGTWLVTGEGKSEDIEPRRPLFQGGMGAIELGVRYDQLGFRSGGGEGQAFRNPRADRLLANTDHVWTLGVNWFPNRWVRVMANAIHERFDDAARTPKPGVTSFWSALFRTRFVL